MVHFIHESRCIGLDLYREPSKFKPIALSLQPTCSTNEDSSGKVENDLFLQNKFLKKLRGRKTSTNLRERHVSCMMCQRDQNCNFGGSKFKYVCNSVGNDGRRAKQKGATSNDFPATFEHNKYGQ
jgi:hypothetical protein